MSSARMSATTTRTRTSNKKSAAAVSAHRAGNEGTRRVPQRTCVVCRTQQDKRDLIRLVQTSAGVDVDETMRATGRGAYLCRRQACWEQAASGSQLKSALRAELSEASRERLRHFAGRLKDHGDTGSAPPASSTRMTTEGRRA